MPDLERDIDNDDTIGVSDEERKKRREIKNRTTGKALQKQWQEEDRFEIAMQEKGLAPPTITEPRCKVCTSEYRVFIERQLVKGMVSLSALAESIPPDSNGEKIDRRSIANHSKKHMAIEDAVVRAQLEEEADLLKQNYQEGVKGALTNRGILRVLIGKTYDEVLKGVVEVEVRDLIQMIKLVNEMESDSSQVKSDEAETSLLIFIRAVKNVCDDDTNRRISAEVKRLREMDDIEFAVEDGLKLSPPIDAIEAEIPDDADIVEDNEPQENSDDQN